MEKYFTGKELFEIGNSDKNGLNEYTDLKNIPHRSTHRKQAYPEKITLEKIKESKNSEIITCPERKTICAELRLYFGKFNTKKRSRSHVTALE